MTQLLLLIGYPRNPNGLKARLLPLPFHMRSPSS